VLPIPNPSCDGAAQKPWAFAAVSLFSGAGLSDTGYELAGFRFIVQLRSSRSVPRSARPTSRVAMDAERRRVRRVGNRWRFTEACAQPLDLLVATPPCQGMSSSNPSRGKRRSPQAQVLQSKNSLILSLVPVALALRPRVIVAENVRQILTLPVTRDGQTLSVAGAMRADMPVTRCSRES